MNRTIATALFSIATLFTIGSASAQDRGAKATVPFDFSVGATRLPAGTYIVTSPEHGQMLIQSSDRRSQAITITSQSPAEWTGGGKLVFARHGNQYFLHAVHCPIAGMNASIPASKQEKRVELQRASMEGDATVLVAAE